jgi:hypothetical protein
MAWLGKAIQGVAMKWKERLGKTRRGYAMEDLARQGKAWIGKARRG